jgi:hypothetical protein
MRSVFLALTFVLLGGTANAACTCQCVDGQMQPLCQSAIDLPPICPATICPIAAPSLAPLKPPTLPPHNAGRRGFAIPSATADGSRCVASRPDVSVHRVRARREPDDFPSSRHRALSFCPFGFLVSFRAPVEDAVIARLPAVTERWRHAEAKAQELAHRGRSGRHAVLEPEVVDNRQFLRREHDLQSFSANIGHDSCPR